MTGPDAGALPILLVIEGGRSGERIAIPAGTWSIGRDPSSDIVLEDAGVSRRHATLTSDGLGPRDRGRRLDERHSASTARHSRRLVGSPPATRSELGAMAFRVEPQDVAASSPAVGADAAPPPAVVPPSRRSAARRRAPTLRRSQPRPPLRRSQPRPAAPPPARPRRRRGAPSRPGPARTRRARRGAREPRAAHRGRRDRVRHRLDRHRPVARRTTPRHGCRPRRRGEAGRDP